MDYHHLRQLGISRLQELAGTTWTDFNEHDPGVTILEQLCFALTDIGYKASFPIQDILTALPEQGIDFEKNALYSAAQILTTHPVTATDFRKLLIDQIDVVENAWVHPVLTPETTGGINGIYEVELQLHKEEYEKDRDWIAFQTELMAEAKSLLKSNRNVCEDFGSGIVLEPKSVGISAQIDISEVEIPEVVLAKIQFEIEKVLTRPIRFHTVQDLLDS